MRGSSRSALLVVASLGFLSLVCQTLVWREFFAVFEGSELSLGWFFGTWLWWVGLGALWVRRAHRFAAWATRFFEGFPLAYLPAAALQILLLRQARAWAGVQPYELFPLARMLPIALLANAPVSLVTGILFPLACARLAKEGGLPPARVYFLEALGAGVGGVSVTLALYRQLATETVFLLSALIGLLPLARRKAGKVLFLLVCGALALRADRVWMRAADRARWAENLPRDSYVGRFVTPQATYLHGEYNGQIVIGAWGSVAESIPDEDGAGWIAALTLAQVPHARSVLVIGNGYSLCERYLRLPQIERVVWLHPDPQYPKALSAVLRARGVARPEGLEMPAEDPRRWLTRERSLFDLIVINLPDPVTLSLNRYFTLEFARSARDRLDPDRGVVAVRFSGGENFMSEARVRLGATLRTTFQSVFLNTAFQPGESSWLFGSTKTQLIEDPSQAQERFAAIPGSSSVYPAHRLLSAFAPDRIQFQTRAYDTIAAVSAPEDLLNTDRNPKALLHALLLLGAQGGLGAQFARWAHEWASRPGWLSLVPLILYGALRGLYRVRNSGPRAVAVWDACGLIFFSGMAGMGFSIVLMLFYQSAYGSLYLHVGLLSACYMLGVFLGGVLGERFFMRRGEEPAWFLPLLVAAHLAVVWMVCAHSPRLPAAVFAPAFGVVGALGGSYVPLVTFRLRRTSMADQTIGALVEWMDHMGGATGGILLGLLLLPLYGVTWGLAFLSAALIINVAISRPQVAQVRGPVVDVWARRIGYAAAGLLILHLTAERVGAREPLSESDRSLAAVARRMLGDRKWVEKELSVGEGRVVKYAEIADFPDPRGGYLILSESLVHDVFGYGGPISLAVIVNRDGVLHEVQVLASQETPAYLERVLPWLATLKGRNLFRPDEWDRVDGVTGATFTSRAILETLKALGERFSRGRKSATSSSLPADRQGLALAASLPVALALRRTSSRWPRRIFLLAIVVIMGLLWNSQFSLAHIESALMGQWPAAGLTIGFLLTVAVPLLTVFFGNLYCGYLCPFGALQELVGELRPASWSPDPDKELWRFARWTKYVLLIAAVALLAKSPSRRDPLTTFFAGWTLSGPFVVGIVALLLAWPYRRFWCRALCVPGAFLSVLGAWRPLARLWPPIQPRCCDYGVRAARDVDCILCDRCRSRCPTESPRSVARFLVYSVCVVAALILAWLAPLPAESAAVVPSPRATATTNAASPHEPTLSAGRGRPVDMDRLMHLIRRGLLSTNEAMYYRRLDEEAR